MGDSQPPLQYLFACSQDAVESYMLSRQNKLANIHRALTDLLDVWLRAQRDERAGRCVLELRRARLSPMLLTSEAALLETLGSAAFSAHVCPPQPVCLLPASFEKTDQRSISRPVGRVRGASLSQQQRACPIIDIGELASSSRRVLCESPAVSVLSQNRCSSSVEPNRFHRAAPSIPTAKPWRGILCGPVAPNARDSCNVWNDLRTVRRSIDPSIWPGNWKNKGKIPACSSLSRNENRVLEIRKPRTPEKPGPIRMSRPSREIAAG